MTPVVVRAPAKINLRLTILARETSGFHQIETIFALVDLADEIRIEGGPPGIRLTVEGPDVGDPADNLVTRAARAWFDAAGVQPGIDILLRKRIPAGAGLGGGSSDAAATLAALDTGAASPLGEDALLRLAVKLGSDVSFFLAGAPYALAWGRGERCLRLPPPAGRSVLLGMADPPVSTAHAYARVTTEGGERPLERLPDVAALATWPGIASIASNDFERVLLPDMPGARKLIDIFRAHDATIAAVTGTGAAVFGVFEDGADRDAALHAARAAAPHAWLHAARTAFDG